MAIKLCPHCNLNYVKPGMTFCKICTKELEKIKVEETEGEVCPVCGVNILEVNEDMCQTCLKNRIQMSDYTHIGDDLASDTDGKDDEMDGMRMVELDEDGIPDDVKEEFE